MPKIRNKNYDEVKKKTPVKEQVEKPIKKK